MGSEMCIRDRSELEGLSDSGYQRYLNGVRHELEYVRRAFIASFNQANKDYNEYMEKFTDLNKLLMVEKNKFNERSNKAIEEQFQLFAAIARKQEIGFIESMLHNSSWEAKRERFKEERRKHEVNTNSLLARTLESYIESVNSIYTDVFPSYKCDSEIDSETIKDGVVKVHEHVHSIFYKYWDWIDDVRYYEKSRDTDDVLNQILSSHRDANEELENVSSHIFGGYPVALANSDMYRLLKYERHEQLDRFSDQLIELTVSIDNKISEAI